jgi:hypothetical protein
MTLNQGIMYFFTQVYRQGSIRAERLVQPHHGEKAKYTVLTFFMFLSCSFCFDHIVIC